jgi:hypothetical protein
MAGPVVVRCIGPAPENFLMSDILVDKGRYGLLRRVLLH